jgi:hypothetical protein
MQIPRGDAHVGVTGGVANLGERATASQNMADERVAAVMDNERAEGDSSRIPPTHLATAIKIDPRRTVRALESSKIGIFAMRWRLAWC